jgi:hypothetical protein
VLAKTESDFDLDMVKFASLGSSKFLFYRVGTDLTASRDCAAFVPC